VPIEPDERIDVLLAPGENLVAVRRSVRLERRQSKHEPGRGVGGDLYVTTQRLIHLGRVRVDYSLCEIRDAVEAEGVLRLIIEDDRGIEIDVQDPRLLRVEIAAVREAGHVPSTRASSTPEVPDGSVSAD
jgi:hypothetical protein